MMEASEVADNPFDFMDWFVLWCALSTMGPYIDRCVFPNDVQWTVVETSNRWLVEIGCARDFKCQRKEK